MKVLFSLSKWYNDIKIMLLYDIALLSIMMNYIVVIILNLHWLIITTWFSRGDSFFLIFLLYIFIFL